jgi:hypothetical protein
LHDEFWGENPGAAGALAVFQARQTSFKESLSPPADDLSSGAEACGDFIVREALVSQKNHVGGRDYKIWQRIVVGASGQLFSLIFCESDLIWAVLRHCKALPGRA